MTGEDDERGRRRERERTGRVRLADKRGLAGRDGLDQARPLSFTRTPRTRFKLAALETCSISVATRFYVLATLRRLTSAGNEAIPGTPLARERHLG